MGTDSPIKRLFMDIRTYWRLLVIILTPILFCPVPAIMGTPAASCAYVVLIMVIFWLTEVVPLPVTGMIPLILFPLMGVLPAKDVAGEYIKDSVWVLLGSIAMALAVERSHLHHRIGLFTLVKIGSSPRRLMLGFMISTCFLSMWMSNTAAAALHLPLALAVLEEFVLTEKAILANSQNGELGPENEIYIVEEPSVSSAAVSDVSDQEKKKMDVASVTKVIKNHDSPHLQRVCKGLLLAICYSANIGGTGTMTGTPTNLVLVGLLDSAYKSVDTGLSFATWMAYNVPQMIVTLALAWLWLQIIYVGFGKCTKKEDEMSASIKRVLQRKYKALPPMSFAEISVLILFMILVLLWLFRKPGFIPGWSVLFPSEFVSDATATMLMTMLLFVVPREKPKLALFSGHGRDMPEPLMTWKCMQSEFPWGMLMLVGGGYAMAKGVTRSCLGAAISQALQQLNFVPTYAFLTISVIIVTFVTEFCSNQAMATLFIPIGLSVAEQMHIHPLYMTLPITVACSFAFMLPMATGPNIVVFSSGLIRMMDMVMSGFAMNIICMVVLLINANTYGYWLFQCSIYPEWADRGINMTNISGQC